MCLVSVCSYNFQNKKKRQPEIYFLNSLTIILRFGIVVYCDGTIHHNAKLYTDSRY